jgi:hypothetical protein
MTIVTEHAIERYAERIVGIGPNTLTHEERNVIAAAIRRDVEPRMCRGISRLKLSDAIFAIHEDRVVTVYPRAQNRDVHAMRCLKGKKRQGVHA